VDEEGRLVRSVGSVNIHDENFHRELIEWVTTGSIPQSWIQTDRRAAPRNLTPDEVEADARFQLAIVLLERGKRAEVIAELKRAFRLDPQNWIIRKQLWAIEHPEAFYEGDVDYGWQKKQQAQEEAERIKGEKSNE
jgi:tetratricopeptide (TPR) repeat protein